VTKNELQGLTRLLFSIEFSDYGATYCIKTKPTLYPRWHTALFRPFRFNF